MTDEPGDHRVSVQRRLRWTKHGKRQLVLADQDVTPQRFEMVRQRQRRALLVVFVYATAMSVGVYLIVQGALSNFRDHEHSFERAVIANCLTAKAGHIRFDTVLAQLELNVRNSTALTPAQKAAALRTYQSLYEKPLVCPPLPSGVKPLPTDLPKVVPPQPSPTKG